MTSVATSFGILLINVLLLNAHLIHQCCAVNKVLTYLGCSQCTLDYDNHGYNDSLSYNHLPIIQTNTLLNGFTKYPKEIQREVGRHERGIFRHSRVMSDLLVTINKNSEIIVIKFIIYCQLSGIVQ